MFWFREKGRRENGWKQKHFWLEELLAGSSMAIGRAKNEGSATRLRLAGNAWDMRFALVIAVLVFTGCVSQPAKSSAVPAIAQPVTLPAMHTVEPMAGDGFWQPTAEDIAMLEAHLGQLWVKPDGRMIFWEDRHVAERSQWKLSDYFIRYHGTTVGGKKIIVGHAVRRDQSIAAEYITARFSISVDGGGVAYFRTKYDVESNTVLELRFNASE
jgi:hypothetical protein